MSDYGLVTGINGNIQFDTRRKVLGLWESGYASEWTQYFNPTVYSDLPDPPPYLACVGPAYSYSLSENWDCNVAAIAIKPSTSTTAIGCTGMAIPDLTMGDPPSVFGDIIQSGTDIIEYAVYSSDTNDTHATPAWGLMTYDENGDVIFNSDINYLKIVDIIEVNRSILLDWGSVIINHDVSNPFYILPNSISFHIYPIMGGTSFTFMQYMAGVRKISATSASIEWFSIYWRGRVVGTSGYPNEGFALPNPFRVAICTL